MQDILDLLPGYNCGECGAKQCRDFADALLGKKVLLTACPHLDSERFRANITEIEELLNRIGYNSDTEAALRRKETDAPLLDSGRASEPAGLQGLIDGLQADFTLSPLPGEPSCREDLYPFDRKIDVDTLKNAYIRYRPLGCPVTHFAKVIDVARGILTVHLIGPVHRITGQNTNFEDIGICMVAGFYGVVNKGKMPHVSQTVRFIPDHCMMQKVHSGVIVHSEGSKVRIEIIDLKVW